MHCKIWLIALFLPFALADKGSGKGEEDEDDTVSTTSSSSSSDTGDAGTNTSLARANASSTFTSMYPTVTPVAPAIRFSMPSNATTCTPVTFQWQVVPPSSNATNITMRLLITNDGVQQSAPYSWSSSTTTMQHSRRQLPSTVISRDLANKTSMSLGSFRWPAVTVPEGWYILEASPENAFRSGIASQSAQFFVTAGSNTSCVDPDVSTAPVSDSHTQLSPGALAGTVVGTVVGLMALLGAFALPRLWRRGVPGHQAWKEKRGGLYRLF